MLSDENTDALIEDVFLEAVFGNKSRISSAEWIDAVGDGEKATWILKASDLRDKVFNIASI